MLTENKEEIVNIFSDKMNCSSSIVLLNGLESSKQKLEEKICKDLKEKKRRKNKCDKYSN